MASIRRSLALSFAQKYATMAINIATVMILARLLTPAEIGIFSVGIAMVGLAHTLRDFGVGNYLIQEKELTPDRVRTAFGVTLVIAWIMAGVLIALSGPMAGFYSEPGVRQVMLV
ncbi:MAG: oligosaccharide flippase family protein, partial [Alphaproteobacteria bacterium]